MVFSFGAIFDWDGVIVDSSAYHEESWNRLAAEEGRALPEGHFEKGFGMRNEYIIPRILHWSDDPDEILRLSLHKEELYRAITDEHGLRLVDGIGEFLAGLDDHGVPCAIGASTHRVNIMTILESRGFAHFFLAIVRRCRAGQARSGNFPDRRRPSGHAPPPHRCIVFEDTPAGIEAAERGGFPVVALTTTHPAYQLAGADRVGVGIQRDQSQGSAKDGRWRPRTGERSCGRAWGE